MGVVMAFPLSHYELIEADITTISDTKYKPRSDISKRNLPLWFVSVLMFLYNYCICFLQIRVGSFGCIKVSVKS